MLNQLFTIDSATKKRFIDARMELNDSVKQRTESVAWLYVEKALPSLEQVLARFKSNGDWNFGTFSYTACIVDVNEGHFLHYVCKFVDEKYGGCVKCCTDYNAESILLKLDSNVLT